MTAIVGMQHDVALPGQVVVFSRHALPGEVGVGSMYPWLSTRTGNGPLPSGTFITRNGEPITEVGDDVALVRAVVPDQPT